MDNAVTWHSKNAEQFDGNYARRRTFGERYAVWTDIIERHSGPEHRVLDVGCGSGMFSRVAARHNAQVVGVDGSREMIELCGRKLADSGLGNAMFIQSDIASIANKVTGPFELTICSSVLEYVDDLPGALRTMANLAAPGGAIAISMPNPASLYRRLEPVAYRLTGRPKYYGYVKNLVTAEALAEMLSGVGVAPLETRYFSRTRFIAPLLHRIGHPRLADNLYVIVGRRTSGC